MQGTGHGHGATNSSATASSSPSVPLPHLAGFSPGHGDMDPVAFQAGTYSLLPSINKGAGSQISTPAA